MTVTNDGYGLPSSGILKASDLVAWKTRKGLLKIPVPVSKVIISSQLAIIHGKQKILSKSIKGLSGLHICVNPKKGVYLSSGWGIGAPSLIAVCEELHVLGATEFYLAGVCGRLTPGIGEGSRIIASSAIREDGTSHHYLPENASKQIEAPDVNGVKKLAASLNALPVKFVSTDAPYRETVEKYDRWSKDNAGIVDMETAALYAFGTFYNIKTYSAGIAADQLSRNKWTMADNYNNVEKQLSNLIDDLIEITAA